MADVIRYRGKFRTIISRRKIPSKDFAHSERLVLRIGKKTKKTMYYIGNIPSRTYLTEQKPR